MFHNTHLLQLHAVLCPPQTNKRLITIRTRTKTVITEGVDYYRQNQFEEGRKEGSRLEAVKLLKTHETKQKREADEKDGGQTKQ